MTVAHKAKDGKPPIATPGPHRNSKPFISSWVILPIIRGEIYRPTPATHASTHAIFCAAEGRYTIKVGNASRIRAASSSGRRTL